MRNIGFYGGGSICELGPVSDVILFWECIDHYAIQPHPEQDWSLLTDRLYRRYLKLEELDQASFLMDQIKEIFQNLPSSSVDWDALPKDPEQTRLDPTSPTLADIFKRYFEHFDHCVGSAKLSHYGLDSIPGYGYKPVKTVISDIPAYFLDKKRSLEEYDTLEGDPFWLR